mgnify:FL=1
MCGIAGWIRRGTTLPTAELLGKLFLVNAIRGHEAAGIAWRENEKGDYHYLKDKGLPYTFWHDLEERTDVLTRILNSAVVILHTRQPTKGSSSNNKNNHPVVYESPSKKGTWLVVHNGMISNDDAIFEKYGVPRYAEVDSASLPVLLDQGETMEESLKRLEESAGAAAIAVVNTKYPQLLGLYRNGPEFHLFHAGDGLIVFSSENTITEALPSSFRVGTLSFHSSVKMPDDHGLIFSLTPYEDLLFRVSRRPLVQPPPPLQRKTWLGFIKRKVDEISWASGMPAGCSPKPEPLYGVIRLYGWPIETSLEKIERQANEAKSPQWDFLTPYGRWIFKRSPVGELTRSFIPHKRVRRWLKRDDALITWWGEKTEDYSVLLNNYARLEEVKMSIDGPVGGKFVQILYLCPWCGIPNLGWRWRQTSRTCEFCLIQSLAPTDGGALWQ